MLKKFSVVAENSSAVSLRDECHAWIAQVAGERRRTETRELWLERAALRSNLPTRTLKALFYGEITDTNHPSVTALRDAAEHHELQDIEQRLAELLERVARLARPGAAPRPR